MDDHHKHPSRRKFLRWLALAGVGVSLASCGRDELLSQDPTPVPTRAATSTRPSGPGAGPTATTTSAPTLEPTAMPTATATSTLAPEPTATPTIPSPPVVEMPPLPPGQTYLAVAKGRDPTATTIAAIQALGGIERFVNQGYDVIIKPNVCVVPPSYEYAYTTNPTVVGTLVQMCLGAGAQRVRVMDLPFSGAAQAAYAQSGIEEAVASAGGETEVMRGSKYKMTEVPYGRKLAEMEIYGDILAADLVINVPIAKHHHATGLTLGCKNLMGAIPNPDSFHNSGDLHQCIADLLSVVRPALTVMDAVRVLTNNGPNGGTLNDVSRENTVIASHDVVAVDSYTTRFFYRTPQHIGYIKKAAAMGLGTLDLDSIEIEEVKA